MVSVRFDENDNTHRQTDKHKAQAESTVSTMTRSDCGIKGVASGCLTFVCAQHNSNNSEYSTSSSSSPQFLFSCDANRLFLDHNLMLGRQSCEIVVRTIYCYRRAQIRLNISFTTSVFVQKLTHNEM